jgi:hypothetical protein
MANIFNFGNSKITIFGNMSGTVILQNDEEIVIDNIRIRIEGKDSIKIEVSGDVENLECGSANVEIAGNSGKISTGSGKVNVGGSVSGNVSTGSGKVTCGKIGGNVSTGSGSINQTNSFS